MKLLFKRYWFLILLAFAAIALLWGWLSLRQRETPPPTQGVEEPKTGGSESIPKSRYTVNIAPISIPKGLAVYSTTPYSDTRLPVGLRSMAVELGFSLSNPIKPTNDVILWQDGTSGIVMELPSGKFTYSGEVRVGESFTLESARQYSLGAVSRWALIANVVDVEVKSFVAHGIHLDEVLPGEVPDFFEVNFYSSIDDLPLVIEGEDATAVKFRVRSDGVVSSIETRVHTKGDTFGVFPLKTWQEVIGELNTKDMDILWVKSDREFTPSIHSGLIQPTITQIYLAYFDAGVAQSFFQPVFVFEGSGRRVNGEVVHFAIYTPAVRSEYLKTTP